MSSSNKKIPQLSEEVYKVEKIIRTIVRGKDVFYDVKWVGYTQPTEQPEDNEDIVRVAEKAWKRKRVGCTQSDSSLSSSSQEEVQDVSVLVKSIQNQVLARTKKIKKLREDPRQNNSDRKGSNQLDRKHKLEPSKY